MRYFLGLLIFICAISCQKDFNFQTKASDFITNDDEVIIKINAFADFLSATGENSTFSKLHQSSNFKHNKLLKYFKPKSEFLIMLKTSEGKKDYGIVTQNDSTLFVFDSISNILSETNAKTNITKTVIDKDTLFHTLKNGFFIGSNSIEKLEAMSSSKISNNDLLDLIPTTNTESTASILFNSASNQLSNLLFNATGDSIILSDNTALDFEFNKNDILYNGVTSADSSFAIELFKDIKPQKLNAIHIAPNSSSAITSLGYNDFEVFNKRLKVFSSQPQDRSSIILNYSNEASLVETPSGNFIAIHQLDVNLLEEIISQYNITESFRDVIIYNFEDSDIFKDQFLPFFSLDNARHIAQVQDFLLFADNPETLKSIISSKLNNQTLIHYPAFKEIYDKLSDASSLFIYKSGEALSKSLASDFSEYKANAVQVVYETDFAHINGVIQNYTRKQPTNTVTEAFSIEIPNTILMSPQTVNNHITGKHDIVVQDVNNILYLISSDGKILWKKQLQGSVLGKIEQIDIYKNGRLQLAFATPKRIYVLDRNGNDVGPFPLKFNDPITQPLSVFDYDNTKNYRLLVTQSKNLLMYSTKGSIIKGFDYTPKNTITSQPKHFRIGSKDYIAFKAGDRLQILSRQGTTRVQVKESIAFSDNQVFLYENTFATTDSNGNLIKVDSRGRIEKETLLLQPNHTLDATSRTLTTLSDNILKIKGRNVDLDFGNYTKPKIFYLNDKIYVTLTDKQSKQVYLFNSKGESIPNFPVYGTEAAVLEKLDKERGLELITQADEKTIVVYKLN